LPVCAKVTASNNLNARGAENDQGRDDAEAAKRLRGFLAFERKPQPARRVAEQKLLVERGGAASARGDLRGGRGGGMRHGVVSIGQSVPARSTVLTTPA